MFKRIACFFAVLLLLESCSPGIYKYKNPDGTRVFKHNDELLKEYALCRCIYYAFGENPIFNDDISLTVYQELSNNEITGLVSFKIDSLAKLAAKNIQPSVIADYDHKKALLAESISFYKSKQLDSLIRSFKKKK